MRLRIGRSIFRKEIFQSMLNEFPIFDYEDVVKLNRFIKYRLTASQHSDFRSELERLLAHYLANSEEAKELQYQIENLVEKQILTGN